MARLPIMAFLFLCPGIALAQSDTTVVTLSTARNNLSCVSVTGTNRETDLSSYTGMPSGFDKFGIYYFDFQLNQSAYQRFVRGMVSKERFSELIARHNIDTSKLSKEWINQRMAIFSGIKDGIKTLIIDTNNNHDFGDERQLEYRWEDELTYTRETIEAVPLSYECYANGKKYDRTTHYKILPFSRSVRPLDSLAVYISPDEHQIGSFEVRGVEYKISLADPVSPGDNSNRSLLAFKRGDEMWDVVEPMVFEGDPFELEGIPFVVTNITEFGDQLELIRLR